MTSSPMQSITGYLTESLQAWRNETITEAVEQNASTTITRASAEAGYAGLALAGLVETVFRSFVFLCAGGIWLCLPEAQANDWKNDYGTPACENMLMTAFYTLSAFTALADNINLDTLSRRELFDKWHSPIKSAVDPVIRYFTDNEWIRA